MIKGHRRSWKVMEGQGKSRKVWIDISDEKSYMLMACRIIVSAPVPVPFLWTLDFGFGFETWIWDLDLGLDLGLTIFTVVVFNNTIALCVAAALSLDLSAGEISSEEDLNN